MAAPSNIFQILEIAAENEWQHGLFVVLPPGLKRDTTEFSAYSNAFNYMQQVTEIKKPQEVRDHEQCKDGNHPEDERPQLPTGWISYKTLLDNAKAESYAIESLMSMQKADVVLICTNNHMDNIHWFWSVVCAGGIPCMATRFSDDPVQRKKQILHLNETLNEPLIITSKNLRHLFTEQDDGLDIEGLKLWTFSCIEKSRERILTHRPEPADIPGRTQWMSRNPDGETRFHTIEYNGLSVFTKGHKKGMYDLAALMLTSGSTGNAKAVRLTSAQIIASVQGKIAANSTASNDVFMSWTGFDHVANMVEIHIHAMYLGANQIMIPAQEVADNPLVFLERIHQHRVAYTLAPNFFLARLILRIPDISVLLNADDRLNLSCLRALVSGGESNVVKTCIQLTSLLTQLGAPASFIRPAFGMTETCAGITYNPFDCPVYDIVQSNHYACIGFTINRVDMKISERGELLLRGAAITEGYYNNEVANVDAFDDDEWFCTGDSGHIDENGRLHLTGRIKDMVVVNALCHPPQGIENAIEDAAIPGVAPSFTAVFGVKVEGFHTESIVVVYLPQEAFNDPASRVHSSTSISKAVVLYCGVRPWKVIALEESQLEKSSLGKLSRSKLKMSFMAGDMNKYLQQAFDDQQFVSTLSQPAGTLTEEAVLAIFNDRFGPVGDFGVNHNIFDLGASSLDIIGIKLALQKSLGIKDIQITTFFNNPILSNLAKALEKLMPSPEQLPIDQLDISKTPIAGDIEMKALIPYDPVVLLNPNTGNCTKDPIFFFHPGVGEVLIFLNISRYFKDRPVYALRAKGFNGESFHNTFDEVVQCYMTAVRRIQPEGPYTFVGYSFGSIVAFEMTKYLSLVGQEVKFLATIDQPPLFKARAKSYDYYECVLTLAFFLGLLKEKRAHDILPASRLMTHDEVLDLIFAEAPIERLAELGMTREKLNNWAALTLQLKKCVSEWDPSGKVKCMDVFYTGPLVGLVKAKTIKEWLEEHMVVWNEYAEDARYHEVGGTHRTLISPPNLERFWGVFEAAMKERGV